MKTFAAICILVVVTVAFMAHGDERTVCSVTMPTDAGTASTAALVADGGCTALDDGGVENCSEIAACSWGPARSLMIQCDNPVRYSSVPDGLANSLKQKTVRTVADTDPMIDFDINPDPYRIDLRNGSQHISLKSVSTSANTCNVGSVSRLVP